MCGCCCQAVVDAAAVTYLAPLIVHPDAKLKRQVRTSRGGRRRRRRRKRKRTAVV